MYSGDSAIPVMVMSRSEPFMTTRRCEPGTKPRALAKISLTTASVAWPTSGSRPLLR